MSKLFSCHWLQNKHCCTVKQYREMKNLIVTKTCNVPCNIKLPSSGKQEEEHLITTVPVVIREDFSRT